MDSAAMAAWLYLVAFGSLIAFSVYLHLLAHASAATATSCAFVNPRDRACGACWRASS